MKHRQVYEVVCPKCRGVHKTSPNSVFLNLFFLEKFCENCGETYPKWRIVRKLQKMVPVKGVFRFLGFKNWETFDEFEYEAHR